MVDTTFLITGNNLLITFFLLIALNGLFCSFKIPILAIPIGVISIIFLLGFGINFSGVNIILGLILLLCAICNIFLNVRSYNN